MLAATTGWAQQTATESLDFQLLDPAATADLSSAISDLPEPFPPGTELDTSPADTSPESRDSPSLDDLQTNGDVQLAGFCFPGRGCGCPPGSTCRCPPGSTFPTVRVTGFFQADSGWFAQDAANIVAVGDIQDGTDFRRARLAATGDVADNVGYMVEFDFGFPGRPSFMDVWMELRDLPLLQNVRIGNYRQPFGLDGLTSVKDLTFIERGLPFAFLPFRQVGAMAHGTNDAEDVTWAVSGFRFPTDFFGGQIGDNGGYGLATRLTGLLVDNGKQGVLHAGGAYSVIDPASDRVRYLTPPEFFISETGGAAFLPPANTCFVPPFVDTGFDPYRHREPVRSGLGDHDWSVQRSIGSGLRGGQSARADQQSHSPVSRRKRHTS